MNKRGFTLVEILTVVAILAILVSASIVGYGAWRQRAAQTELVSDLRAAAAAMTAYRTFYNGYPTSLPADYHKSENVTATLKYVASATYCIEATTRTTRGLVYHMKGSESEPKEGGCDAYHAQSGENETRATDGVLRYCHVIRVVEPTQPAVCEPELQR